MPRIPRAISCLSLLAALAVLTGCGSSGSGTSDGLPEIPFKSPAITGTALPARFTCDGKNALPTLEWGAVPAGTGELAMFVVGFTPESSNRYSLSVEWAVAGVNPQLHKLAAGPLPAGAHAGLTTAGKRTYSVCPEKGQTKLFQFEVYGVPEAGAIPANFKGLSVLSVLNTSNHSSPAIGHGVFDASYAR